MFQSDKFRVWILPLPINSSSNSLCVIKMQIKQGGFTTISPLIRHIIHPQHLSSNERHITAIEWQELELLDVRRLSCTEALSLQLLWLWIVSVRSGGFGLGWQAAAEFTEDALTDNWMSPSRVQKEESVQKDRHDTYTETTTGDILCLLNSG